MLFIHEMDGCFVSFTDINRAHMLRWPIHLRKLCIGTSANIIPNFKWWFSNPGEFPKRYPKFMFRNSSNLPIFIPHVCITKALEWHKIRLQALMGGANMIPGRSKRVFSSVEGLVWIWSAGDFSLFDPKIWGMGIIINHYLGGGFNSFLFSPWNLWTWWNNLTSVFFRWVETTSFGWSLIITDPLCAIFPENYTPWTNS